MAAQGKALYSKRLIVLAKVKQSSGLFRRTMFCEEGRGFGLSGSCSINSSFTSRKLIEKHHAIALPPPPPSQVGDCFLKSGFLWQKSPQMKWLLWKASCTAQLCSGQFRLLASSRYLCGICSSKQAAWFLQVVAYTRGGWYLQGISTIRLNRIFWT